MNVLLDRLQRRGGRMLGVGGLVAMGILVSVSWMGMAGTTGECSLQIRYDQAWTPTRQASLAHSSELDAYAGALLEAVEEGCASSVSAKRSCTRQLVERFDTALGLLTERSATLQPDAIVSRLPELESCEDHEAVNGEAPEVDAMARRLQRVDALALAGDLDEALDEADEAVDAAHRLGAPALSLEAFFQRAKVHARRHELEPANSDFAAAYELAVVARDQAAIVRLGLSLVWVNRQRGDLDAAEHWLRVASAALETAEDEDPKLAARLLQRRGEVHQSRGEMAQARKLLTRAAKAWAGLDDAREEATVLTALVWADLETGNMDAALEHAQRSIDVLTAAFGDDEPQLATHYLNLGNAHQRRDEHEASVAAYGQAVERRMKTFGNDHPATAMAEYSKATALLELERFDEARALLERAQPNLPQGHPAVAACDLTLAQIASLQGEHREARTRGNKALVAMETTLGVDHPSAAEVRAELARIELAAGDPERALADARTARVVFERTFGPGHDYVATCATYEARALVALERGDEAVASFERAIEIIGAVQGDDSARVESLRDELRAALGS